jgi:transposase
VETLGAGGELLFSLFSKRRRSINTSLSKMRLTEQAKADLQKEQKELEDLESEFQSLQQQQTSELQGLKDQWAKMVNDIHDIPLPPARKDIFVERFGIAWQPYYVFKTGDGKLVEASACTAE